MYCHNRREINVRIIKTLKIKFIFFPRKNVTINFEQCGPFSGEVNFILILKKPPSISILSALIMAKFQVKYLQFAF